MDDLSLLASRKSDADLILLRAYLDAEMRRRKIAFSVGSVGESLAISLFKSTPKLPKLQLAPPGTKNVDALSRHGDRYSIKTICAARKTGTIYPDRSEKDRQLFEFLLIVVIDKNWELTNIYQFSWGDFLKIRSWDARMNAWYVGCSRLTLNKAVRIFPFHQLPSPL